MAKRRDRTNGKPSEKPDGTSNLPARRPGRNGGSLNSGNPGNKGGGQRPKDLTTLLRTLKDRDDYAAVVEAVALDGESRNWGTVFKELLKPEIRTLYHPEVRLYLDRMIKLIASRATWDSNELLLELAKIGKDEAFQG